ncbi:MAG: DNA polymerase III subunit alpha [Victivallaceae bacterium]|nr:DNA polymerase III subunit alpha [Victivallaceae bacterium]
MAADFVHLHLHSHYSLLDGACTISGLIEMAKKYDMPALAVTDHGFMGGIMDMYRNFSRAGIKPIAGCEAYVSPTTRFDKNPAVPNIRGYHLLLLAKDLRGYYSLCKLMSEAAVNGFFYKPRIDKELLAEHHAGLLAFSACVGGEVPHFILNGDLAGAEKAVGEYTDIFGRDNFYLEVMDHGLKEEKIANRGLVELAKKLELPLVATNDVHYLRQEHAKAHEIMLCIQTGSKLDDPKRFRFSGPEYYFKSPDEMKALFREIPQAVTNTVAVAERCGLEFKFAPEVNHYPVYQVNDPQITEKELLRNICCDNMPARYGFEPRRAEALTPEQQAIVERMDYELEVIDSSKYCSYFLVVADFINYAKQRKIPVGPGRGSGAGSVVAYLTNITNLDPLKYNLLFERFLNPERVSPPDFDIDFCEKRRFEVIDYVRHKYGEDSVSQIGTYGTLKAKAVIKDVARVLGRTFEESDRITKLIPGDPKMTLERAVKESADLRRLIDQEAYVREIFEYAEVLEGINRQMGIHAAGVIIGDQRLDNLVPLTRGAKGEIITSFPALPCEELGLLKMDFLGLKTLTIIQNAVDNIRETRRIELDIDSIPFDDTETFALLNRGDTVAVFQLESTGMQNLCRQLGIEKIEHIIALVAMYRPGPMQFIPDFIARKKGEARIEYDHPRMESLLKETYGIMVYQEQIMQVVQVLAGFSLGGADILRRAIGKKKEDVLADQKAKFIRGCAEHNQIGEKLAAEIWEKISKFAGYGFNKSHSAAYAFIAYQTAYLKANYPVEFMAAVLSAEIDNADKIAFLMTECREMGINVLPPDVNSSGIDFSVDGNSIRFGLGAVKGCGEAAAGKIIEARRNGCFVSFLDFCERCGEAMNSRVIEHFAKAGAFDTFGLRRSQILAVAEATLGYAAIRVRDRLAGQGSLFDLLDDSAQKEIFSVPVPDIPEFDEHELLKYEKELLGFYVTGHPLGKYCDTVEIYSTVKLINLNELDDSVGVRVGGIVKNFSRRYGRRSGKAFGVLEFEDLDTSHEAVIYNSGLEQLEKDRITLDADMPVLIEATTRKQEETGTVSLVVERVVPMERVMLDYTAEIHVHFFEGSNTAGDLEKLLEICRRYPGNTSVILCISCLDDKYVFIEASSKFRVAVTNELLDEIRQCLGEKRWRLKANDQVPEPKRQFNFRKKETAPV